MIESENCALLVRVWLLGAFHAERRKDDGTWEAIEKTAWENSYARPLLKRLLCATDRRVARSDLLDDLWPNTPDHLAEKYLNNASSKLRQVFHKQIIKPFGPHGISGYQLAEPSLLWTDIDACEVLMREAERIGLPSAEALPLLEQASKHFERGGMLEGESGQWCLAIRTQKEAAMRYCRILLAESYEAQHMLWQARSQYQKLLETSPIDEDVLCRLMAFLHRHGMTHDARACYEQAKNRFKEYGLSLSPVVTALAKKLANELLSPESYLAPLHRKAVASPIDEQQGTFPLLISPTSHDTIETASNNQQIVLAPSEIGDRVHPLMLQTYEDMLTLAWEAFYTSKAQSTASTVDHWLLLLKQQAASAPSATARKQILMFLCRFLQLGSVLARDRTDFPYAFSAIHEAIALAFQLEDVELTASSLYRRAKLYAAQRNYELALSDLEAALPYASRSRNPLRCYISMFLAEVYSLYAPGIEEFFQKSLEHLDSVDQSVCEQGVLDGDGSFVKVDVSGLYMIRGDVLRRKGEIHKARNALNIVRESLPKEFTRWQGNLHLSTSQLFLAEGDIANSCQQMHNALDIFQTTSSRSGLAKTQHIYRVVQNVEPARSDVKELEMRLGILESR